jgi:hypothetical protein
MQRVTVTSSPRFRMGLPLLLPVTPSSPLLGERFAEAFPLYGYSRFLLHPARLDPPLTITASTFSLVVHRVRSYGGLGVGSIRQSGCRPHTGEFGVAPPYLSQLFFVDTIIFFGFHPPAYARGHPADEVKC